MKSSYFAKRDHLFPYKAFSYQIFKFIDEVMQYIVNLTQYILGFLDALLYTACSTVSFGI